MLLARWMLIQRDLADLPPNLLLKTTRRKNMRYGIAWLLGVPVSVLVIWWVLAHVL
jgi:hypothetical protein